MRERARPSARASRESRAWNRVIHRMWNCRCAICIAVSLYPVWADVDAIYQVLKQAGEIRGNSTNSPPTPPTAEHPSSGAAPSSARASSHPCSSSTSGKTHRRIPVATLERSDRKPRNSSKRNPTGRAQHALLMLRSLSDGASERKNLALCHFY